MKFLFFLLLSFSCYGEVHNSSEFLKTTVPKFKIKGTIVDAINLLREESIRADPDSPSLNVVYYPTKGIKLKTLIVNFENVPMGEIIKYLCLASKSNYRVDQSVVVISHKYNPAFNKNNYKSLYFRVSKIEKNVQRIEEDLDHFRRSFGYGTLNPKMFIVIPKIKMENISLGKAIKQLMYYSSELSVDGVGLNIEVDKKIASKALKVNLRLRDVLIKDVLYYICESLNLGYEVKGNEVLIK